MKPPQVPDVDAPACPDVGRGAPVRRPGPRRTQGPVVAVVALGGALGASARYGASLLWPTADGGFPWTTVVVNAVGCGVIGVFMVVISDVWAAHRLVRPFFGTGVLGGFTTFSAYAVDVHELLAAGRVRAGLACAALTPLLALVAVGSAAWATRRIVAWRRASVSGATGRDCEAVRYAGRPEERAR